MIQVNNLSVPLNVYIVVQAGRHGNVSDELWPYREPWMWLNFDSVDFIMCFEYNDALVIRYIQFWMDYDMNEIMNYYDII